MSVSVENFVKTIYIAERAGEAKAKISFIAGKLGVSAAAATDMARKLSQKKLLHYLKYKPVQLTDEGKQMAVRVIRKHRLWESFLHEVFKMDLHEIHREAEMLEHQTSDYLAERLSAFLGNPKFDPHGDPIPDKEGRVPNNQNAISLTMAKVNGNYRITRLMGDSKSFIQFCENKGLTVGALLEVTQIFEDIGIIELQIAGNNIVLNTEVAQHIVVEEIK